MACWIVVPVKAPGAGKTRLAGVLDEAARRDLVATMLRAVLAAAAGVDDALVMMLGPSRHGLADTLPRLDDPGGGLGAASASVVPVALAAGIDRLVFVSGDLPRASTAEIAALAGLAPGVVGIAPDRAGQGTNALSLPLPEAGGFVFGYGSASFGRHRAEAARLGLSLHVHRGAGLALDIDLPEDLAELASQKRDGDT